MPLKLGKTDHNKNRTKFALPSILAIHTYAETIHVSTKHLYAYSQYGNTDC